MKLAAALGVLLLLAVSAMAQQAGEPPSTRTESIERQRDEKSVRLTPEALPKPERIIRRVQDERWLERLQSGYKGLRPLFGGLATGGGFALGGEYRNSSFGQGYAELHTYGQVTTRLWQKYGAELSFPRTLGERLNSTLSLTYRDYNSLDYYGPGMSSRREGRSNYRYEDTSLQGTAILRPQRKLRAGFGAGYLWTNVGPGQRRDVISTERIYNDAQAPGLTTQANFVRYGLLGQYDYRDNPLGPKTGGNYVVQMSWFRDQSTGLYDFRRVDIDFQQYFGFFNNLRRIALRARGTFTDALRPGGIAPFYLRPTIGGSDDLRGYRPYRFNDENSLVLNGEYRWEIFSGLDGALFFDAGKVMPKPGHLAINQMEGSAGFGLRANIRNQTFMRIDVGFSREGYMIWFKFNDAFNSRRFGTGAMQPHY